MEIMPVLFVGHGNPMYTLGENEFTKEWQALSKELPKPKAVFAYLHIGKQMAQMLRLRNFLKQYMILAAFLLNCMRLIILLPAALNWLINSEMVTKFKINSR